MTTQGSNHAISLQPVLVQWSAQAVEDSVFQMPFWKKIEIEERKDKILSITREIADLQSKQNTIKERIEHLLEEDTGLQVEQNKLIEEVKHLLVEIDDGEAGQQKRYGSKKWSWGMLFRALQAWALLHSMRYRSHLRVVLEHNRIKGTATKHSILQCTAVLLLLQCIPCERWVGMQQNRVNCYRKKNTREYLLLRLLHFADCSGFADCCWPCEPRFVCSLDFLCVA